MKLEHQDPELRNTYTGQLYGYDERYLDVDSITQTEYNIIANAIYFNDWDAPTPDFKWYKLCFNKKKWQDDLKTNLSNSLPYNKTFLRKITREENDLIHKEKTHEYQF